MFLKQKVKDVMTPIADYATTTHDSTLKEAVQDLRKIYCQIEVGKCTEAGHRTSMVLDENGELVGILDFRRILNVLVPEIAGTLSARLQSLGLSVAFAEGDAAEHDEARRSFETRVRENAETKVGDVMLKVKGTIGPQAPLLDALKLMYRNKITVIPVIEEGKLVGVVRDSDLFLAAAAVLSNE